MTALAALALAPSAHAAPLRAGVGTADITPENGGTTFGFVRPGIMVKGVRPHIEGTEVDVYKNWTLPGVPLHGEQKEHTPVTADFTR